MFIKMIISKEQQLLPKYYLIFYLVIYHLNIILEINYINKNGLFDHQEKSLFI